MIKDIKEGLEAYHELRMREMVVRFIMPAAVVVTLITVACFVIPYIETIRNRNDRLEDKFQIAQSESREKDRVIDSLTRQTQTLLTQNEHLQEERDQLAGTVSDLQAGKDSLATLAAHFESALHLSQSDNRRLTARIDTLSQDNLEKDFALEAFAAEEQALCSEIQHLTKDNQSLGTYVAFFEQLKLAPAAARPQLIRQPQSRAPTPPIPEGRLNVSPQKATADYTAPDTTRGLGLALLAGFITFIFLYALKTYKR